MGNIVESKSILAKLMATEDITVRHMNVVTASFDVKSRVLTCPIWKDMDGELYDLLLGHEVGHALWTNAEGWHDALCEKGKGYKGFLNIVEDARIERKIKDLYPGIRRSFVSGYKQLFKRNFFGINGLNQKNYNKLRLIDRLNIYTKGDVGLLMPFSKEERKFLKRLEKVETWEDVVKLANDIYAFSKENEKNKIGSLQALKDFIEFDLDEENSLEESDGDSGSSNESEFTDEEGEDSGKKDSKGTDERSDDSEESDEQSDEGSTTESNDSGVAGEDDKGITGTNGEDDPQSITDESFRENQTNLVDESAFPLIQLYLPKANLSEIIVSNKVVVEKFETNIIPDMLLGGASLHYHHRKSLNYSEVSKSLIASFHKRNGKYISLLVKEFEMRKNAKQYQRQRQAKTGELDSRRLHNYCYSSDIFRKITTVDKGKNHGMILFLDMSGSMAMCMKNTIDQLLVLVTFCKKVGIPFDVYGFCDVYTTGYVNRSIKERSPQFEAKDLNNSVMINDGFHLKNLISSDLSQIAFKKAFSMLSVMGEIIYAPYHRNGVSDEFADLIGQYFINPASLGMGLGGTPFIQTLVASKEIVKNFRIKTRTDIVSVVYLTDGAGENIVGTPKEFKDCRFAISDHDTKISVEVSGWGWQVAITKLMKAVIGCRHIGFYIGPKTHVFNMIDSSLNRRAPSFFDDRVAARSKLIEDGVYQCKMIGYDSYYIVVIKNGHIEDHDLVVADGTSNRKLTKLFIKNQNSKTSNRAIAAMFVKEISGQIMKIV